MKKIILSLMLIAATAFAFDSCKKDPSDKSEDPSKDAQSDDPTPVDPTDISTIYIFGSATTWGWDTDKMEAFTDNGGGIYSWQGYLSEGAPFRFPLQRAEWPALMIGEDGESLVLGNSDDDLIIYTVDVSGDYDIIIDMRDKNHPTATVELLQIDLNNLEINELYMLGEACATGWALDLMEQFDNDGGVFTWEGPLAANKRFRFPLQKEPNVWWPCLMLAEGGKVLYGAGDEDESNVPVEEDGVYNLTIDTRDRSNMTYTIVLKSAGLPDPEITELYLLGDAAPCGWTYEGALPFENNEGIFTWEGKLRATGQFRFNTTNKSWFPAIVVETATGKPIYTADWDETIHNMFTVDKEGIYSIEVDARKFDDISVEITYVGDSPAPEYPVEELYLLGDATEAGWDINAMPAFTGDKGEFTLTTTLKATGGFRFLTQKAPEMWFPAICKDIATGKAVYVDIGQWDDTIYAHYTVDSDGTYKIDVTVKTLDDITCTITKQ